jgi:fumarylacetoacetate (FAA) hydrolase
VKLASLDNGERDGQLVVVSRDLSRAVSATGIAPTMQWALEHWTAVEPQLRDLAGCLEAGAIDGSFAFDVTKAMAPLPRAWQWLDGSVFRSHADLIEKAYNLAKAQTDRPLMYQGLSHQFLGSRQDMPLPSEQDGIDFEGEFGVITDDVPMGTAPHEAADHIKLLVQINDWSLREIGQAEMRTGFGWVRGKPACTIAPIALTPDELGPHWAKARVCLPLHVWWNDAEFGFPNGEAMAFGFDELIAHAASTRSLCAGTVIGSGTVSNESYREVGSTCIAERRGIEIIDHGEPITGFMRFGDTVRMEARLPDGTTPFGAIAARVVSPGATSELV